MGKVVVWLLLLSSLSVLAFEMSERVVTRLGDEFDYGIMLDAGSSSTKVWIYNWPHRDDPSLPLVDEVRNQVNNQAVTKKTTGPLHALAENLAGVADHLELLVNYTYQFIPENKWPTTPIYLKATAGMRSLTPQDQQAVLEKVREYLRTTPYNFTDSNVMIISGALEGLYAWVSVNYYLSVLDATSANSTGALDMGSGSTQITFTAPNIEIKEHVYHESYNGNGYDIYSYSFENFGDTAFTKQIDTYFLTTERAVLQHPCLHEGYEKTFQFENTRYNFTGSGNVQACRDAVRAILDLDAECSTSPCSMQGVYQPSVTNRGFAAFSSFWYTANFLLDNLADNPRRPIQDIIDSAEKHCARNWSSVSDEFPEDSFVWLYCQNAVYFTTLLTDAYGISSSASVLFLEGFSWNKGAMIHEARLLPFDEPTTTTPVPTAVPDDSSDARRDVVVAITFQQPSSRDGLNVDSFLTSYAKAIGVASSRVAEVTARRAWILSLLVSDASTAEISRIETLKNDPSALEQATNTSISAMTVTVLDDSPAASLEGSSIFFYVARKLYQWLY